MQQTTCNIPPKTILACTSRAIDESGSYCRPPDRQRISLAHTSPSVSALAEALRHTEGSAQLDGVAALSHAPLAVRKALFRFIPVITVRGSVPESIGGLLFCARAEAVAGRLTTVAGRMRRRA
jgi:hypothetical protein